MKIVYNSFGGRYSDNPRAIYETLLRREEDHEHLWLADPLHRHGFPAGVLTVPFGGDECLHALETADMVVSNTHIELEWTKAEGAEYLQTWHGTPLKHIHFDVLQAPPGRLDYLTRDVRRWDHLISPNTASTGPLRQAFGFPGEVVETGYPRNDVLVSRDAAELRARVRRQFGIPDDKKVVLYTPTWRDDLRDEHGRQDFQLHLDLDQFTARLGADHVLLMRLHYMVSGRLGPIDHPGVFDVSFHPDVSDLYLAADVMITDYSSTMFDFAVTGKPLLFFTYDLAHYRDTLRGFYFDFHLSAPGPLLHTNDQLIDALTGLDTVQEEHREVYARFQETFAHLEDGGAAARVADRFFAADRARPDRTAAGFVPLDETAAQATSSGSVR
jgi:CDP-glycerol glycerophosphotransferase